MNGKKKSKVQLVLDGRMEEEKQVDFDDGPGGKERALGIAIEIADNGWIVRVATPDPEVQEMMEEVRVFKEDEREKLLAFINQSI